MRTLWMVAAAIVVAGGAVGCTAEPDPAPAPGTTVTAAPSGGNTAAPGTSSAPAVGDPGTTRPSTLPDRDDATVDARDYQQGGAYYFQSPTGNIMCGFYVEGMGGVGCQLASTRVIPAELRPSCDDSPARKVAAQVEGGSARFFCTSQGVFVGMPTDGSGKGGGRILNYGDTLIVRGLSCTSTQAGVRCDDGRHGFTVSADAQTLF
ncbi:DUF6636 domain-containing protein [Nocardia thailandica]|uniref:DUF6636 domain-containing protein n=1 Tax=Nocardia thailandica TaxID=257275 RepID=UPI001FDF85DB|nr:DUF6636 domain-containing protein [Nocardia thailandica]